MNYDCLPGSFQPQNDHAVNNPNHCHKTKCIHSYPSVCVCVNGSLMLVIILTQLNTSSNAMIPNATAPGGTTRAMNQQSDSEISPRNNGWMQLNKCTRSHANMLTCTRSHANMHCTTSAESIKIRALLCTQSCYAPKACLHAIDRCKTPLVWKEAV